jgi:hypothetical protein
MFREIDTSAFSLTVGQANVVHEIESLHFQNYKSRDHWLNFSSEDLARKRYM